MLASHLLVGVVVKPQGVLGQVKVHPQTDDPERFHDLDQVYVKRKGQYEPISIEQVRVHQGLVYCVLDGAMDREHAEAQRGMQLYVSREQAVPLDEDRHFIADLVGCNVVNTLGEPIGVLKEVLQPGAADVYVIKTSEGTMMLPALKRAVIAVNVKERVITLDEKVLPEVAVLDY